MNAPQLQANFDGAAEKRKMVSGGKTHYASRLAVATYDLFHSGSGDVPFYLDCARRFGGPILERGSGQGAF